MGKSLKMKNFSPSKEKNKICFDLITIDSLSSALSSNCHVINNHRKNPLNLWLCCMCPEPYNAMFYLSWLRDSGFEPTNLKQFINQLGNL